MIPLMHEMNLIGLDLNLLAALDAMLRERSVSRAAARVGVSQPAMSHSLSRLRAWFDDPLLVRSSGGMIPTKRAEQLEAPLRAALEQLRQAVQSPAPFEPSSVERAFVLVTTDYGELNVLPPLAAQLTKEAPKVDLLASPDVGLWATRLEEGACDLYVGPLGVKPPAGIRSRRLYKEQFVCVMRRDHPAVRKLTVERFANLVHVLVAPRGRLGSPVDDALAAKGLRRRVAVMVPHFLVAPWLVAESDMVITLPRRTALRFCELLPLKWVEPPLKLPGFDVHQAWHERVHHDPFHRWMRDQVVESVR